MPAKKPKPWTPAESAKLGKMPDSQFARRTGRTIKAVVGEREARGIGLPTGRRRWTAREIPLLGQFSDMEVARRLRRNRSTVREQRVALGIAPLVARPRFKPWPYAQLRLLGKVPDEEL